MSPIINLQRRMAEKARIRLGEQVPTKSGKKRPSKLRTFRITSQDRDYVEEAAALYGGTVTEFDAGGWAVTTEADTLNVIVPPGQMAFSQWYELWGNGFCKRRCDGQRVTISDGPCLCDPDTD